MHFARGRFCLAEHLSPLLSFRVHTKCAGSDSGRSMTPGPLLSSGGNDCDKAQGIDRSKVRSESTSVPSLPWLIDGSGLHSYIDSQPKQVPTGKSKIQHPRTPLLLTPGGHDRQLSLSMPTIGGAQHAAYCLWRCECRYVAVRISLNSTVHDKLQLMTRHQFSSGQGIPQ